jgi:hypothetical protein
MRTWGKRRIKQNKEEGGKGREMRNGAGRGTGLVAVCSQNV